MSNSMYSNIDTDDVFASAMEEAEIVENPFGNDGGGDDGMAELSEPLHAVDAARRLLGNDDLGSSVDQTPGFVQPSNANSNSVMGGNSLLERIQQQKKQQSSSTATTMTAPAVAPASTTATSDFGYPMVEEGNYTMPGTAPTSASASASATSAQPNSNSTMRIPEYSQTPAPNAYNPDSAYNAHLNHQGSGVPSSSTPIDYKDTAFKVLSAVGSAAGTVAMGAYQGTKIVYSKMTKINSSGVNGGGLGGGGNGGHMGMGGNGGGGNMNEMDYQRQSLLMDPHDVEEQQQQQQQLPYPNAASTPPAPSGMRAGIINANSINDTGSTFLNFVKSFCVDMKDLFMGASRRVQIGVIVLAVFIIWLIFFE